jgi:hypothetical protein
MAAHPIKISVINNQTGIPQSTDGIMMMFIHATAIGSTFALDTPYLLTKLADATALGITAANDATNGIALFQQVNEFYAGGTNDGLLLWIQGVAKATNFATYVAGATFAASVRATGATTPANRAKMIGICYKLPTATQTATDFPSDVPATITALQAAQVSLFNQGYQFSAIVDGYNMSTTVTAATIGDISLKLCSSISLCITGTIPNGVSSVGLALSRFAKISIGHGFGAVADGSVAQTAYLTKCLAIPASGTLTVGKVYTVYNGTVVYNSVTYVSGTDAQPTQFTAVTGFTTFTTPDTGYCVEAFAPIVALTPSNATGTGDIDLLGSKQYMFLRTWFAHSGFYWNDGATCTTSTLALSTQEYNRVANALSADALAFFINQIGSNQPLDTKTGAIAQNILNSLQQQFYDEYISPLSVVNGGTGDLTDGKLILTAPNFNATKTMNFSLQIVPTPILGSVVGTIQFVSTI